MLSQFDYNTQAETVSFAQALFPTGWTGFVVVASVLTVHLIVGVTVVVLFAIKLIRPPSIPPSELGTKAYCC